MFDRLTRTLTDVARSLSGKSSISEKNVEEAVEQIKLALLEAAFSKMPNVTFRKMAVVEAVWEAYLAKMGPESRPILERAAEGVPIRRLIRDHESTMRPVFRPGDDSAALPRGAFDPGTRKAAPWAMSVPRAKAEMSMPMPRKQQAMAASSAV